MFLPENTFGQSVLIVGVEYGNGFLDDDGAVIQFFVHEMHRTAGNFDSIGKGLLLGLETRE